MKYKLFTILFLLSFSLNAQTHLVLSGGQATQTGGNLVVKNANFTVNGTFAASAGKVEITGAAVAASSKIGGTGTATFYNVEIDKSSNNAQLGGNITIANQLTLTNGNLDVSSNTCTIGSSGTITGATSAKYVKTSSTGTLAQTVAGSNVVFPVGNSAFNPMTLSNGGTSDVYHIRVTDDVLDGGTSGISETADVVDRTWLVTENVGGGSDLTMTAQWNVGEELSFVRNLAVLSHYTSSWDAPEFVGASGSNPYTVSRAGITSLSPFSVREGSILLSVAVLPSSSIESVGTQLVYTFTRSGNYTTGNVMVSFSVGGTAEFGTDYSQSGAATFNTTTGTVLIPNGVSSATVILTPTGDTDIEADETIVLTVTGGS
ncbi:MAG: hypothetical protein R3E32_26700 [Chitinophagales bacterium]